MGRYVDQLNKMGLERLMEIYQEALDVYNNAADKRYSFRLKVVCAGPGG